jgi:hypothetical protein
VTITNSTFSNNSTSGVGGGIHNSGTLTVTSSFFKSNSAFGGGGIRNESSGTVTITDSLFETNSSTGGGGGIFNWYSGGTATLKNTIIALSGGNCANTGTFTAQGKNFATDGTCPGFTQVTSADLNLGPLANNGGPTQTHALGSDSVAIDAATDCTDTGGTTVTTDQRGAARPQGSNCDVGSYEAPATTCFNVSAQASPTSVLFTPTTTRPATRPIRVRVVNNSGGPVEVSSITLKNPPFGGDYSLVSISPTLPQTVLAFRSQMFTVTVRKAAGTPAETVTAPFFEVQLGCGLFLPAWQKSRPLQVEALRVRVGAEQLEVEATGEGIGALTLELFDLSGRKRLEQQQAGSRMSAALSPLANGVYFYVVRVRGDDGREYVSEIRKLAIVR